MFNKSFLILLLLVAINILASDQKTQLKTPQNDPELYAKVLKRTSLMTGCDQAILAKIFHNQIVADMNNPKITDLIDFELDVIAFGAFHDK